MPYVWWCKRDPRTSPGEYFELNLEAICGRMKCKIYLVTKSNPLETIKNALKRINQPS